MHIFISYAKTDTRELATRLYEALNALPNITAWMDQSLEAGSSWASQIENEIDRADLVLALLSPDVNRSASDRGRRSFVLNETDYAHDGNKQIIPVMAQKARLPVQLAGTQYIDVVRLRNVDQQVEKIIAEIGKQLDIRVATSPDQRSSSTKSGLKISQAWATIVAAIITGIFAVLAAFIMISGNNESIPPTLQPTQISLAKTATDDPSETPVDTATQIPSEEPTATSTPTITATDTLTATPTELPTHTPTPSETLTTPPTNTPTDAVDSEGSNPSSEIFNGVEYVMVPTGEFEGQVIAEFWIGRYEVTNAQFAVFINQRGSNLSVDAEPLYDENNPGGRISRDNGRWRVEDGFENHPVTRVTWYGAKDFCDSNDARLPTELEWRKAASWNPSDNSVSDYPWGSAEPTTDIANFNRAYESNTLTVDSLLEGQSALGLFHMSGNASEWLVDQRGTNRFLVGGGWDSQAQALELTERNTVSNTITTASSGFRCVR